MDEKHAEQAGTPTEPSPPAHVAGPLVGTFAAHHVLAGRYEIRSRLGAGGMGFVYRAHDRALDEEVALKVLFPERFGARSNLRRIRREVKLARKVTHPNVCRVYDIGEDGDIWFLTMELVEGRTLRSLITQGRLAPERALTILEEVAAGLAATHAQGVVHLDLKPDNIMIRPDGRVVVVDFGLARIMSTNENTTGNPAGTLAYMSPEHLRGGPTDVRSDVFSLGIVTFELLTGRLPGSLAPPQTGERINIRDAEGPLHIPGLQPKAVRTIEQIILQALAKSPEERFATAADFGRALAVAQRGASTSRDHSGRDQHQVRQLAMDSSVGSRRKHARLWLAASGVLGLAGTLAVSIGWESHRSAEESTTVQGWPGDSKASSTRNSQTQSSLTARPSVAIKITNRSGDISLDAITIATNEVLRAGLLSIPEIRVLDEFTLAAAPGSPAPLEAVWTVAGSVQRVEDRLSVNVQAHAADGSKVGRPIGGLIDPSDLTFLVNMHRQIIDEMRLLWRAHDRHQRAEHGTASDTARANLFRYYMMVGPDTGREYLEPGITLLDRSISEDGNYVPALIERALVHTKIASMRRRPDEFAKAHSDLNRALEIMPFEPHALTMRCRLLQAELELKQHPTDAEILVAASACTGPTKVNPPSAHAHIALALIYDLQCQYALAAATLEEALKLDSSLSGHILDHRVSLAIRNGGKSFLNDTMTADAMSQRLAEFQTKESSQGRQSLSWRTGVAKTRTGHILRAAVLIFLDRFEEAKRELEREAASETINPFAEFVTLRGLARIAHRSGSQPPLKIQERLTTIEQSNLAELEREPHAVDSLTEAYALIDGDTSIAWLNRLPQPNTFLQAFKRARIYHMAGDSKTAGQLLARYRRTNKWERTCAAWLESRISAVKRPDKYSTLTIAHTK